MIRHAISAVMVLALSLSARAQVEVNINSLDTKKVISPYIYGKNNSLSDNQSGPLNAAQWQKLRDMGIRLFRENGGNNATKYNWRKKLSSHPDWYNNVYSHNWDFAASSLGSNIPQAQGMWAFQLIGKAAKTTTQNFNDWNYNGSQWWEGCRENLAGGGSVVKNGDQYIFTDGDPNRYLENWDADSTTAILDHWFGGEGIGLDPNKIRYWSMDNEPEIWNGTHDDVYPDQPTAEEFMQMYFAVAKKARQKFPDIKLVGPVPANEWQWYNWDGGVISYNGKSYSWLEYFILRIAEEQQASGMRLLDVLDIHFYPGETGANDITQLHRVFFDTTYNYPGANGVKRLGTSGWDNSITKEYIFKRCSDWLKKYIGPNHGVTFSLSETSLANTSNTNVTASWYASVLGEFAKQGVEIFTPWDWHIGMSEVVHLFTRYGKRYFVPGASSDERYISAYPTINYNADSITVFFVNRHLTESRTIDLNILNFYIQDGTYKLYYLSSLPATETFVSKSTNALKQSDVQITSNNISLTLPALSVAALVVSKNSEVYNIFGQLMETIQAESATLTGVVTSNSGTGYTGTGFVTGFDTQGDKISASLNLPAAGVYRIVLYYTGNMEGKHHLIVNNNFSDSIIFPVSAVFSAVDGGGFNMNAGVNNLVLSRGKGETDIDKIEVYRIEKNIFNVDTLLIDPNANQATCDLYKFLQYQFGDRIISGQTHDYYNEVKTLTGKSPMLRAADFQHYTQGYSYFWLNGGHTFGYDVNATTVNEIISWYNSTGKKGIVSMHWHWHAPDGDISSAAGTNTFYTDQTTFDIRQAVIPGTNQYDCVIRDIDSIATQLKKLQNAGIPVIWRPLHEAGGGWFWWGAHGAAPCLALWDILQERLMNYHQIHNLIWTWSTPEPSWYPGNDKVDMIGYDSYPGEFNYTSQKTIFDNLYTVTRGNKLIAMTENGPIPDPDACLNQDAPWLYFMSWSDLVTEQNTQDHIKAVFDHPAVLTLESTNAKTGFDWRSSLYPEDWKPGYKDGEGRFLHDFSYAGYHGGKTEIPFIEDRIINITQAPYHADNTGSSDVTAIIQDALDDAGEAGGGVVYLPAGTYRISVADTSSSALRIKSDSTILRGDGPEATFLLNTTTSMRNKDIIQVAGNYAGWFSPEGSPALIAFDLLQPTKIIPVQSTAGFATGDKIIITSTPTDEFIAEHNMTGNWTASAIKGVAFMRTIQKVDEVNGILYVDAPTRYALKMRDQARVYHAKKHLSECGIESLSIGNSEHTGTGWDEETYSQEGTGAYDVHFSQIIHFKNAENCWVRRVNTFKPSANALDVHLLSNGIKLNQCRYITIDSCRIEKPQYEGGGGNGYMFTIESNDCLVRYTLANHGRHNYDFKYPYSNGNVILRCKGENSKYASDFHMFLSMANLFDDCTLNGDFLESTFRPYGGTDLHGYTSTQSVFYNTFGEAYHPGNEYIIDSRQFGWGYIIGTSGPAYEVKIDPAEGTLNGYAFNTTPRDFTEGIGNGQYLVPSSLYLDQLEKRQNDSTAGSKYRVNVIVRDAQSNALVAGSRVIIYNDTLVTGPEGMVSFDSIPEFFSVKVSKEYTVPVNKQYMIFSDTTFTLYLTREQYLVKVRLVRAVTLAPIVSTAVTFASIANTTNSQGEASFTVYGGNHGYLVNKPNFQKEEGTFTIGSDTTLVIMLTQTHATIRFRLRLDITPVNGVLVSANDTSILTNSLGDAVFTALPVSVSYPYSASKTGYEYVEGTVYLTKDTVVLIPMTKVVVSNPVHSDESVECWPNPVSDVLHIKVRESDQINQVIISNMNGLQMTSLDPDHHDIKIDVSAYHPGSYILRIITSRSTIVKHFIKK